MMRSSLFRPDWTPLTIGLMVLGFIVFWPLGLAMLGYIIWGDRLHRMWDEASGQFGARDVLRARCRGRVDPIVRGSTGNIAFDEFREREIVRLQEERRKLDEMRAEFDDYLHDLRRAKDQSEFDRFMKDRSNRNTSDGDASMGREGAPA